MVSRASKRKNIFSEIAHIALNIALVIATFLLVYIGGRVGLALLLVPLSKWRIFAVRPRFWKANLLANIVDITVSCGLVIMMYLASTSSMLPLELQVCFAVLYAVWLIGVKPRTLHKWVIAQAAIGLFIGIAAVSAVSHMIPLWLDVVLYYVIGYGVARHILTQYKERQYSLFSMIFGLLIAEVSWIAYHWNIGYGTAATGELKISELSILVMLMGLASYRLYLVSRGERTLRSPDVMVPVIFSVIMAVIVLVLFSASGRGL